MSFYKTGGQGYLLNAAAADLAQNLPDSQPNRSFRLFKNNSVKREIHGGCQGPFIIDPNHIRMNVHNAKRGF